MLDIISDLKRWREGGKSIALTTILETRGSSLRPAGTRMAFTADGEVSGSISSGCVDGDAIAEMEAILNGKATLKRITFGISDEQAWSTGLACGGSLDVLIERWDPLYDQFIAEVAAQRTVSFATHTERGTHLLHTSEGESRGTLGSSDLNGAVLMDIAEAWPGPYAKKHTYPQGEVFIEVIPPPPTLLIFGATDIAIPLTALAQTLNFKVIVSDARSTFLTEERFPDIDTRLGWPKDVFTSADFTSGWAIVVLFHDQKLDIPALTLALRSRAFYVGMLGSRKTQADRREQLRDEGFKDKDLERIHGPIGLDLGGKDPAMIALSILSEIVAVLHRREGGILSKGQ